MTTRTDLSTALVTPAALPAPTSTISPLLQRFSPIGLGQMTGVALMDRSDIKFMLNQNQLQAVLPRLAEHYWMLDINGTRLFSYQTLYFDTPDFALYRSHHAQARNRFKVRSRRYADTNVSFMEVKYKTGTSLTSKRRVETPQLASRLTPETATFIETIGHFPVDTDSLTPQVWNDYSRITLVNKQLPERVTIDLNMEFNSDSTVADLPGLVIAEVKQAAPNRESAFLQAMHTAHIRPMSFSKYCMGVCLLYDEVKHNNFKPQLLAIHKTLASQNATRGH